MNHNIKLSPSFDLRTLSFCGIPELDEKNFQYALENPKILQNLTVLCSKLEVLQKYLKTDLIIIKGVVSPEVNKLLLESSNKSPHMEGVAIDFICPEIGTAYQICNKILKIYFLFDQLYNEKTFVHMSLRDTNRMLVMTRASPGAPYLAGIQNI